MCIQLIYYILIKLYNVLYNVLSNSINNAKLI